MDTKKIDTFLMIMKDKFPNDKQIEIREELLKLNDDQFMVVQSIDYKNPFTMLIISFFLGGPGIDRLLLGHKKIAILKVILWFIALIARVLSAILLIIPYLIVYIRDIVIIRKLTREWNYNKFMDTIKILDKNISEEKGLKTAN